jgi:hypothetical protein
MEKNICVMEGRKNRLSLLSFENQLFGFMSYSLIYYLWFLELEVVMIGICPKNYKVRNLKK